MLTHAQIWNALDRLAARNKLTASGLAKKAGLDPTTFNKSKRITPEGRQRWPSTESVAKALAATSTKVDTFVTLITDGVKPMISTVPLIGFAQAGEGGHFDDSGYPVGKGWDEVALPHVTDEQAYALKIAGELDEADLPARRHRHRLAVEPDPQGRPHRRQDPRRRGDGQGTAAHDHQDIELKSLNAEHRDRTFPVNEIDWMARILWASQ